VSIGGRRGARVSALLKFAPKGQIIKYYLDESWNHLRHVLTPKRRSFANMLLQRLLSLQKHAEIPSESI
jgi:hypothetical protein